jgi:asparagine synthase (glutamine-hydrolysing)
MTDLFASPPPYARRLRDGLRYQVADGQNHAGDSDHPARVTHPFTHRPLIEFVLALRPSIVWGPEHPRSFVLSALADVLPEPILTRRTKGNAAAALTRDLSATVSSAISDLDRWILVRAGYADAPTLRDLFSTFIDGSQLTSGLVRRVLQCEALLRRARRRLNDSAATVKRTSDSTAPIALQ